MYDPPFDDADFPTISDQDLIDRWCLHEDEDAAAKLFKRYYSRLRAVALMNTPTNLQGRIPPSEIANSAFLGVFSNAKSRGYQFDKSEDFWKLLVSVALNKVRSRIRLKRNQERPISIDATVLLPAREPSFEKVDGLTDVVHLLQESLNTIEKIVFKQWLHGKQQSEIAELIGRSVRQVRRIQNRIKVKAHKLEKAVKQPEAK